MGVVSNYMENPSKRHWEAIKYILQYLRVQLTSAYVLVITSYPLIDTPTLIMWVVWTLENPHLVISS